jgi:hypothetical protein
MLESLLGWVKGLFGGKGSQIGSRNKSSQVTVGDNSGHVIVGDNNVVQYPNLGSTSPPKQPIVRVQCAVTSHPFLGLVHCLSITFLNTTDRSIFIGNFFLAREKDNVFLPADSLTGERQGKREIRPGDKFSFHIDANTLRSIGSPATDYLAAVVEDAVGPPYESDKESVQGCIADLLKER